MLKLYKKVLQEKLQNAAFAFPVYLLNYFTNFFRRDL